jgi:hypothetical protein
MTPRIKTPRPLQPWRSLPIGQFFLDQTKLINMVIALDSGFPADRKALVCWCDDGPYLETREGGSLVIRLLDSEEIEFSK